jgi:GDP-mannose 6-dehydrogenase
MKVSIFGLGYVGCVSLGCLAQNGFEVIGVDISQIKVDLINKGLATIIEKDIDGIIKEQRDLGRISASTDYRQAVLDSDVSIICVGTPSTERGDLNLGYIFETARQIGSALKEKGTFHIVVIRSTVLPGTNSRVGEILAQQSGRILNTDFAVVSNPEFLREGTAVADYYNPPFTLIGTDNESAASTMRHLYAKVNGEFIQTDIGTAEIIKYVNNSYHALKVTFANEVGLICKNLGIDSHEVMRLFCLDRQLNISPYYFKPGFAYGGSCLPKDLKALKTLASDHGVTAPVLESIEPSNQSHIQTAIRMIENVGSQKVGVLGVAFKEGTDDLRYSPVVKVIEALLGKGYQVRVHDPYVKNALLIGANKDYVMATLPYLESLMIETEEELVDWADMVVINRNKKSYTDFVLDNKEKKFLDLVRISQDIQTENYTGICW